MFLFGMILIIATLIYMLVTNNVRNSLLIFGVGSIAYFIFGYGVPLNKIPHIAFEADMLGIVKQVAAVIIVLYLLKKFEDTIFPFDYKHVFRSFFFRFETITLALYLLGILISSGNLIIDFLVMVAIVRLTNTDKFISYITVNAVLITNAIFIYPKNYVELFSDNLIASELLYTNGLVVALFVPAMLLLLYFAGFLVRSLEKEIFVEVKILGIIALSLVVGYLGVQNLSSRQLLIYIPVMALTLLALNDLNVRKKFSRYSQIPVTLSIILLVAFIFTIYISQYSFILFFVCAFQIHSILLNERYKKARDLFEEPTDNFITSIIGVGLFVSMVLIANYSLYNSTTIGIPYVQQVLIELTSGTQNVLARTFELYANSAYFSIASPTLISNEISPISIQYLITIIPALSVIAVPTQLLILSSTGYKTKIAGEIMVGVIALGLITLTFISFAIGV